MRVAKAIAFLSVSMAVGGAEAQEVRNDLGLNLVVGAESRDPESGSLPGGQLELAHWHGPFALVAEGARISDDRSVGSWVGAGVRMLPFTTEVVSPRGERLTLGTWLQLGVAHEAWDPVDQDLPRLSRNHVHVGLGLSGWYLLHSGHRLGVQIWYRVQVADREGSDFDDIPSSSNMIAGAGFAYGI